MRRCRGREWKPEARPRRVGFLPMETVMGVDLTLIPVDADNGNLFFGHSLLEVERRRELWPLIKVMRCIEITRPFSCHMASLPSGEVRYGDVTEDDYGEQLKTVCADDLLVLRNHDAVSGSNRNRAIWAYLHCLQRDTRIVLFWY